MGQPSSANSPSPETRTRSNVSSWSNERPKGSPLASETLTRTSARSPVTPVLRRVTRRSRSAEYRIALLRSERSQRCCSPEAISARMAVASSSSSART